MKESPRDVLGRLISRVVVFSGLALFFNLLIQKSYLAEFQLDSGFVHSPAPFAYFFDAFIVIYTFTIFAIIASLPSRYLRRLEGFANIRIWASLWVAIDRATSIIVFAVLVMICYLVAWLILPSGALVFFGMDWLKSTPTIGGLILFSAIPIVGMMRYYDLRKRGLTSTRHRDIQEMTRLIHIGLLLTVLLLVSTYLFAIPIYYGAKKAQYDTRRLAAGDWGRLALVTTNKPIQWSTPQATTLNQSLSSPPDYYVYTYVPHKQDLRLLFSDSNSYFILCFFEDGSERKRVLHVVSKDTIVAIKENAETLFQSGIS